MVAVALSTVSPSGRDVRSRSDLSFYCAAPTAARRGWQRLATLAEHHGDKCGDRPPYRRDDVRHWHRAVPARARAYCVAGILDWRLAFLRSTSIRRDVLDRGPSWNLHEAALHGSSHYDLPPVLRWFTANIGVHHVHHLSSRIPYYRLPQVLRDYPELGAIGRLTLVESLRCVRLVLWG